MITLTCTYKLTVNGDAVPLCSATVEVDPGHTAKAVSDLKAIWPPGPLTKTVDAALVKHVPSRAPEPEGQAQREQPEPDAPG